MQKTDALMDRMDEEAVKCDQLEENNLK